MNLELVKTVVKEKGDIPIRPVVLKFGVAIAIGGVLYTYLRNKKIKAHKSKSSGNESGGLRSDNDGALQHSSLRKVSSQNSISGRSSSGRHSGDKDGFLLPEFTDLVKECNIDISPRKTVDSLVSDVESPKEYKGSEHDEHEREVRRLRTKVKFLEERERNLEIQLLKYYGIKNQETAVMELQNRLRLNNMEAKLFNLKIESLLSDNKRLEAQVTDYAKVATELEAAKAKVKLLRKKLKSEAEQNREQILSLQDRVMKLHDQEQKSVETNQDLEMQLKITKELVEELEEMKKLNQSLKLENSDLAHKLEYVQMLATSALDNEEVQELKEQSRRFKQRNEDLTKEIERLQADRCSDMEELVYLRRTNACLRYELSNYNSCGGKAIIPRKSEEKAKQHVLENANKEGSVEKGSDITDFDSSSQASCLTDSGEHDDLSSDNSSTNKTKTKMFAKLKKLLRGKGSRDRTKTSPLQRTVSVDEITSRYSSDIASRLSCDMGVDATSRNSSGCSSRRSFDLPRSYSRSQKSVTGESSSGSQRISVDGSMNIFRSFHSLTEGDWSPAIDPPHQDARNDVINETLKRDESQKNTRSKSFRRSASFGSR